MNNTQEALAKIETLIDDAWERANIIENGCLSVKEIYSSEKVVDEYLGILGGLKK